MSKKKLIHFQENLTFPHLFQPGYLGTETNFDLRSMWHEKYFRNHNPIIIELGCGKGEYTVGLASKYPGNNYIGIDTKGARLWRGCKSVQELNLQNVAFIRTRVDFLGQIFSPGEADELWITFPDPYPGKERKRLTSPVFLDKYRKILKEDGIIHLKTDNQDFFSYSLEIINNEKHSLLFATDDVYQTGPEEDVISIQTYYEKIWLDEGKKICYLKFMLRSLKNNP